MKVKNKDVILKNVPYKPAKEKKLQHRGPDQLGTQRPAGVRTTKAMYSVFQNKALTFQGL